MLNGASSSMPPAPFLYSVLGNVCLIGTLTVQLYSSYEDRYRKVSSLGSCIPNRSIVRKKAARFPVVMLFVLDEQPDSKAYIAWIGGIL